MHTVITAQFTCDVNCEAKVLRVVVIICCLF